MNSVVVEIWSMPTNDPILREDINGRLRRLRQNDWSTLDGESVIQTRPTRLNAIYAIYEANLPAIDTA
jgi:hypothetical protein